jgi:hypothetical protein
MYTLHEFMFTSVVCLKFIWIHRFCVDALASLCLLHRSYAGLTKEISFIFFQRKAKVQFDPWKTHCTAATARARATICFNLLNKKKEFECFGYKTPTSNKTYSLDIKWPKCFAPARTQDVAFTLTLEKTMVGKVLLHWRSSPCSHFIPPIKQA